VGLLTIQLNWMPERLEEGSLQNHTSCNLCCLYLIFHDAVNKLHLNELGTWLFLAKFRHKVENVLQGWTLSNYESDKFGVRTKGIRKKKNQKKKGKDKATSSASERDKEELTPLSLHLKALGRYYMLRDCELKT
jgi:hypothetical protein